MGGVSIALKARRRIRGLSPVEKMRGGSAPRCLLLHSTHYGPVAVFLVELDRRQGLLSQMQGLCIERLE